MVLEFLQSLPSPIAQGMIWGIMAIGVFITFRVLDLADLTVDGSIATGGAEASFAQLSAGGGAAAPLAPLPMLLTHIHSNNSASMASSALVILFLFAI